MDKIILNKAQPIPFSSIAQMNKIENAELSLERTLPYLVSRLAFAKINPKIKSKLECCMVQDMAEKIATLIDQNLHYKFPYVSENLNCLEFSCSYSQFSVQLFIDDKIVWKNLHKQKSLRILTRYLMKIQNLCIEHGLPVAIGLLLRDEQINKSESDRVPDLLTIDSATTTKRYSIDIMFKLIRFYQNISLNVDAYKLHSKESSDYVWFIHPINIATNIGVFFDRRPDLSHETDFLHQVKGITNSKDESQNTMLSSIIEDTKPPTVSLLYLDEFIKILHKLTRISTYENIRSFYISPKVT